MKVFTSILIAVVAFATGTADAQRRVTAVVDILAYNDVYEMLPDTVNGLTVGGPSRVVAVAKEMKAKNPNSLVLFAGDTMSPSLWSSQFKGMQMVDAHKAIGLDFASLGNHEFDFGIEGFLNVSNAVNFPWLNANCYEIATGALLRGTQPRAIKTLSHPTFGTIKIGLFGIMYDMKDPSKGLRWTDPFVAARRQVAALQAEKVDMIIALTHQDLADDNRLSKEVTGINLIYGGHDHASMLQTNFGAPYMKADFNFRSVWMSRVEYFAKDTTITVPVFRMKHEAKPITGEMPTDKGLEDIIADYSLRIGKLFERVVGSICEPGLDLTNKVVRVMDAPIGHIFADAQLKYYGPGSADVSISNGGGIRTDKVYPAGPLTLGQVVAWSPFGNTIMIVETDGKGLVDFIEKQNKVNCGANSLIIPNGLYAHPAGIRYTYKCTAVGVGSITSIEWFEHPTRTGPVLPTDVFKLALNNFLYNTEFSTIAGIRSRVLKSEAEAIRIDAALDWYVGQQENATICEKGPVRSIVTY